MSLSLANIANESATITFQWNWRLAQQAFADIVGPAVPASSVMAERAARSLSALSADERIGFERWLALQLLSRDDIAVARRVRQLSSVDATLATSVRRQLAQVAASLAPHGASIAA